MNRRGKRLTLGVMAVGLAVVIVLVGTHWGTVRDHVEAWHFQLARETWTFKSSPDALTSYTSEGSAPEGLGSSVLCQMLARFSNLPVVLDPIEADVDDATFYWLGAGDTVHGSDAIRTLARLGFRVLEQRFPRQAYVVMRDTLTPRSFVQEATAGSHNEPTTQVISLPTPREVPSRP